MAIRIKKSSTDGMTGHIQVVFCVEEKHEDGSVSCGPDESATISPFALMRTYHGTEKQCPESTNKAIMKWLSERHDDALQRKHHIEMTTAVAQKLQGKVLEF